MTTTLKTFEKSTCEFIEFLCQKLCDLLPHAYIASQQSLFSKEIKGNLKDGEYQVIVDYAENYSLTVQDAAPGFHWNNDQATVYNIVIYHKEDSTVKHCSLVIISDCLTHDAIAVYMFHKILISFLRTKFSSVKKIMYFSDGAPQQYKNFKNVINLAYYRKDFDIDAEWHFNATFHGKGPCDGLGATVKRAAIRASLQSVSNQDILSAQDLYNCLKSTSRLPNVEFEFCSEKTHNGNKKFLNKRFQLPTRIERLQEQHGLVPVQDCIIRVRKYSTSANYKDKKIY